VPALTDPYLTRREAGTAFDAIPAFTRPCRSSGRRL